MPAQRPLVLVFQEFASLSTTPATPDLNCLIAGPAYWIQDFPSQANAAGVQVDNRANTLLADVYGELNAACPYSPPVANVATITVDEPPSNKTAAVLDPDSVRVYFGQARVELVSGTTATTAADDPSLTAGSGFVAAGVLPGDTCILTSGGGTIVRTVRAVVSASELTFTSDVVAEGSFTPGNNTSYRVERTVAEQQIDPTFVETVDNTNTIKIKGGVTLPVGGVAKPVTYARAYVAYRSLRQDLADVGTVESLTDVVTKVGLVDARNPLAVGLSLALQNTASPIQYFGVTVDSPAGYTLMKDAISSRKDIYAVVPLITDVNTVKQLATAFDELASVDYAVENGTSQKFRVVIGAPSSLPLSKDVVEAKDDGEIEDSVAESTDISKLVFPAELAATAATLSIGAGNAGLVFTAVAAGSAGNDITIAYVDPAANDQALAVTVVNSAITVSLATDNGGSITSTAGQVKAAIEAAAPAAALVTVANAGTGLSVVGAAPVANLTGGDDGAPETNLIAAGVLPGDKIVISGGSSIDGTYYVAQVKSATELTVDGDFGVGVSTGIDATLVIYVGSSATPRVIQASYQGAGLAVDENGALYLDFYSADGTFVDDLVIEGRDYLAIPKNPASADFDDADLFLIETVVSNQRVVIKNNGRNTSTTAKELPHGATRAATVTAVTGTDANYKVVRSMVNNQDEQVTELLSVPTSINSRRAVICWPDQVEIVDLVDGSLPRANSSTPTKAGRQPGYYLACAVGGMTAGLPSHQGFTNMGIAGVKAIRNATPYFSDRNITDLSNNGWLVFQQDTPSSLPYIVHALTTDPSTLEFGEFMMVKNFDFVSMYFHDIVTPFIGTWNINDETLGFIRMALQAGIEALTFRRRVRIGAPIVDARITSVSVSESAADRLETYIEVNFPKPLNVVALHLVSVAG